MGEYGAIDAHTRGPAQRPLDLTPPTEGRTAIPDQKELNEVVVLGLRALLATRRHGGT